ncbi:hypothetical protein [Bacterioplanoides sp.]|uniref:hypothetical protein n=1 Tax=Bacterioplanoides sp. TaxID=2066072 RepID=UPI003B00EE97
MKLITRLLTCVLLLLSASLLQANGNSTAVNNGAIYPVDIQAVAGESDGNQFLSLIGTVQQQIDTSVKKIEQPFEEWAYNRGIGKIPSICPAGYSENAGLCARDCPAGFDSVAGVCWQQCPAGFSDTGAFCTQWKWWPETITKRSWVQERVTKECPQGQVNEAGLCYEPCADTFNGVGPMCFGQFGAAMADRILEQAEEQHQTFLATAGQGGIVVPQDQTPTLKTDISFAPIVCGLDAIEGFAGLPLPDVTGLAATGIKEAGNAVIGAISDSIDGQVNTAWYVPSLAETVLFDFTTEINCADDGTVATASLNMNPSISVQASTRMFDPALHALAGVDLGIMSVSVYELIPFRIYGSVGSTMSAQTQLTSTVNRSQPPVIIHGVQHANQTRLDVTPEMDMWLSSQAYVRITSILNFLPDLLQIGADFKLWVMELSMPYALEEGVRVAAEGGYETYKTEALERQLNSGRGYVDTFLKVLGIDINAFGDEADIDWQGREDNSVLLARDEAQAILL